MTDVEIVHQSLGLKGARQQGVDDTVFPRLDSAAYWGSAPLSNHNHWILLSKQLN